MNKLFLTILFLVLSWTTFAQKLPTVAVAPFDVMGGITKDDATVITELFRMELASKGTINVVEREDTNKIIAEMNFQNDRWSDNKKTAEFAKALNANYVITGQLMKMGNKIYMTSKVLDVKTLQIPSSAKEELQDLSDVYNILPNYCKKILSNIGPLSDFAGTWYSKSDKYFYSAIFEFYSDGSIVVKQYQSSNYDHVRGTGSFSIDGNRIDISLNIINDKYGAKGVSTSSVFTTNDSKTSFTLINSTLWSDLAFSSNPYSLFVKGGK